MWAIDRWRLRLLPRLCPAHIALALYFLFACLSLLFAAPNPRAGLPKLLGIAELCALTLITSDLASRPRIFPRVARTVAITSLVSAGAALLGLAFFYAGISSHLIGIYGELEPSSWYARVQAGTHNPNLLASFCIFASAIVAHRDGELPGWLRRITLTALWITVCLTFSRGILGFILAAVIRGANTRFRRRVAAVCGAVSAGIMISLTIWNPSINPAHPLDISFRTSESSRLQAATSSFATLLRHPLFGSGLGTSPGQYLGAPFDSHLTPLNIAATLGLPSLISFVFLVTLVWRRRMRPTDLCIWGALAGMALDGLAQDTEDFRHLWVMLGFAGANASVPEKARECRE
ncbi:MAG TPA: O-antigen ligase family protein [Blastocatellia bacterium]|nr:O-antigen ligase family protein [Blastocatellia bacterium]